MAQKLIKNIDEKLWKAYKGKVKKQGLEFMPHMGKIINELLRELLGVGNGEKDKI